MAADVVDDYVVEVVAVVAAGELRGVAVADQVEGDFAVGGGCEEVEVCGDVAAGDCGDDGHCCDVCVVESCEEL